VVIFKSCQSVWKESPDNYPWFNCLQKRTKQ